MTSAFVERAWRDGLGPDDRVSRSAPRSATSTDPDLLLFAAWFDLLVELAVEVPPPTPTPSAKVLHAAAMLASARIARDATRMQAAIADLGGAPSRRCPTHRSAGATAARAWADYLRARRRAALAMADRGNRAATLRGGLRRRGADRAADHRGAAHGRGRDVALGYRPARRSGPGVR